MNRKLKPKENPLIKPFNKHEPISQYRFAQICGVSLPAILNAVNTRKLFLNSDETITPAHVVNQVYMQKKLIKNMSKGEIEEIEYRQAVLTSLLSDTPITESGDTPEPEPLEFNFKNLPLETFVTVGYMDENNLFRGLIKVYKLENKCSEISIIPNNKFVSIGMEKESIVDLFLNSKNVGELFFIPA